MELLSLISDNNTLVCKICEHEILFKNFTQHSSDCKDISECRHKLLESQAKLSDHITKAYDLRNQLNTNFVLEKKKLGKSPFHKNNLFPSSPRTPSSDQSSKDKNNESFGSQVAEFMAKQKEEVNSVKRRVQRAQTVQSMTSKNMEDYEDEIFRCLNVLKAIMQYQHLALNNINEINLDQRNEFRVKHQVHQLYLEIKDKQISEYVEDFLNLIQDMIKYKHLIARKQEDLSRSDLDSVTPSNANSPVSAQLRPNSYASYKSPRVVSLDDEDISPKSRKRSTHESFSGKILFPGSEGNSIIRRKLTDMTPNYSSNTENTPKAFTGLSRFAFSAFMKDTPVDTPVSNCSTRLEEPRQIKGKVPFSLLRDLLRISQVRFKEEEELSLGEMTPRRGSKRKQTEEEELDQLFVRRISTLDCEKRKEIDEMNLEEIPRIASEDHETSGFKRRGSDRRGSWDLKGLKVSLSDLVEAMQPKPKIEVPKRRESKSLWGRLMVKLSESDGVIMNMKQEEEKLDEEEEESSKSSSCSSCGSSSDDEDEEDDEIDNEISLFSTRGYYSDSERCQVKNLEQNNEISSIEEFDFIKLLGKGAYGKVYLVKKKKTGDLYAMKIVDYADKVNLIFY